MSIRALKDLVIEQFPENHPLRAVILGEKDELSASEILAKMGIWSVLVNRRT